MPGLHFLFLQGEPSPYYKKVGDGLAKLGCKVTRINFCAGDWVYWHGSSVINYRDTISGWPDYLIEFLHSNNVTDLFLCGEKRIYHRVAIDIALSRGIRVTVTDLGYLRPDWITLERDGMNGSSRFTRNPDQIVMLASNLPEIDLNVRYKNNVLKIEVQYLLFELANALLRFFFPHYRRTDNRTNLLRHYLSGIRRFTLSKSNKRKIEKQWSVFKEKEYSYFLLPMQLEYDYSILSYSRFSGMEEPILLVMKSFSENANVEDRLVFKSHPLDSGIKNWSRLIYQWALKAGIADRIEFFDGGNLDQMIKDSKGMVTVNSTSGIRALQLGRPVKILGSAIYDVVGMVSQESLDEFWKKPQNPNSELVHAFVKLMAQTVLVRGTFFNEPGLSIAVKETVQRLYENRVGLPLNTSLP